MVELMERNYYKNLRQTLNEDQRWELWRKWDEGLYRLVQENTMSGEDYMKESDSLRQMLGLQYSFERDWRGVRYY